MQENIRLTQLIHHVVRGNLGWHESLSFLDEIADSNEWIDLFMMEHLLYSYAKSCQTDLAKTIADEK